jgi:hypothetical protein
MDSAPLPDTEATVLYLFWQLPEDEAQSAHVNYV